ncbi:putative membrane protein [Candidatus Methanophagaceae archaeon]|nr:putative membrane protein [Methanophagales archaeon]
MNISKRPADVEKIIILSIIFIFPLLILLCFTIDLKFATGDPETAGMIFSSVGVGGLSSIFAIVISLSLMAVQFASQQYTHRIMDIHINSLIFKSVIAIYLVSIAYNVFMIGWLELDKSVDYRYVEISMLLAALSLFMLFPYFYFTMRRLRPESVISKLLAKIDEDYLNSIKRYFKEGEPRIPGKADKMLPITEIIEKSLSSGDRETVRFGIGEVYECYMSHLKEENEDYVSPYFMKHLLDIGRETINRANDASMVQLLEIFGCVGKHAILENMSVSARMSVECIDTIGFKVLEDYDVATQQMIDSLQGMLREIINSGNEEVLGQIFTLYHNTSDELFTLEKDQMLKYMANSFSELPDLMMRNRCYDIIERTAGLLECIGIFAVNLDLRDVLHQSVHSLYKMGISSAKDNLVWETPNRTLIVAERIIDHLLKIEEETLKCKSKLKEFDSIINEIEYAMKDIEKYRKEEEEADFSDLWH